MPRSPTRTSTGSPGTRRIATNVTNISATNVGTVRAMRLRKYLSMSRIAPLVRSGPRALLHVDTVELVRAEGALLETGDSLAHRLVDHRMRDLEVGRVLVLDHLHFAVELRAFLAIGQRLRTVEALVELLVAPFREVLSAGARRGAAVQEEEVVGIAVVAGPAELRGGVLPLLRQLAVFA